MLTATSANAQARKEPYTHLPMRVHRARGVRVAPYVAPKLADLLPNAKREGARQALRSPAWAVVATPSVSNRRVARGVLGALDALVTHSLGRLLSRQKNSPMTPKTPLRVTASEGTVVNRAFA
jgi:hypothetical protein